MKCDEIFWYVTESLKALTPILIGAFAGWIAWRQWRTGHIKLKLDLFERRLKVYNAVTDPLNAIGVMRTVSHKEYFRLRRACGEAEFLFPQPVLGYMRMVLDSARRHRLIENQIARAKTSDSAQRLESLDKEEIEIEEQIERLTPQAIEIFRPYLDFRDIR